MTGNLAEYENPQLYDQENPDFEPEGPFYRSIAQDTGGPDRSPLNSQSDYLVNVCEAA